jgi:anti-anti-sigma factor
MWEVPVLDATHPGTPPPAPPPPAEAAALTELTAIPDLAVAPIVDARPAPGPDLLDGLLSDGEDTVSLVLDGAVDGRLEAELAEMLASLRSADVRHIVLELATVTAMDATGLRFLHAVQGLALERGGTVRFADPSGVVLDLLAESGSAGALRLTDADTALDGATAAGGRPGARPA